MTTNHDSYMATPPDMSGSIAKNRFRVEVLWGVEKLLDCLDKGVNDFSVIFDYRCDIELHLNDGYEFYQVKTGTAKKFGITWVCKKNPKTNTSIIGRLYELHDAEADGPVRLIIVGNKEFLKAGGSFKEPGELLFSTLSIEDKRKVEAAIREHLPAADPDLDKVSYLLVAMDLSSPEYSVAGHLIKTYEAAMGCEPRKPNALYNALCSLADEKACEEQEQSTYENVIRNKAITHAELSTLFDRYADRENSRQDFVMAWIGRQPPLQRNNLKLAYGVVFQDLYRPSECEPIRAGIKSIENLDKALQEDNIINQVAVDIKPVCGIEVSDEMREIYAVVALYSVMEGGRS